MRFPRSRGVRLVLGAILAVIAAGVAAAAVLVLHSPGNVSHPSVEFTAPPQNYGLIARVLTSSIGDARSKGAADRAAHERGLEIGTEARRRAGKEPIDAALVRKLTDVLRENGFEPMRKGNELRLRNCPFDALANDYRDLVCGMNLAMQRGVLEGLRARKINAVFEPVPGACCVAFKIGLASRRARSLSAS